MLVLGSATGNTFGSRSVAAAIFFIHSILERAIAASFRRVSNFHRRLCSDQGPRPISDY